MLHTHHPSATPHVLLRMGTSSYEQEAWRLALQQAMPDVVWHPENPVDPDIVPLIQMAVVANPPAGSLQGYPNLQFVQSLWAGVEKLLADETVPPDLVISRMVDPALAAAMGESAVWATLTLHRHYLTYAEQQQRHEWLQLPQVHASRVCVGVLGLGEMGRQVANRIATMGYNVWGWRQGAQAVQGVDSTHVKGADALTRLDAKVGVVLGPEALPQALAKTHILINVLPLTKHTRGILNADLFAKLPPGASVVNFARGPHVVDADLIDALNQGHLDRAILDVYHQEPLPSDHPFWKHPRIVLWPHIAARTDPMTATQVVVQQLRAWAAAEPVRYVVSRSKGY